MRHSVLWILSLIFFILPQSRNAARVPERVKTSVFLSPPFFLRPGSVVNNVQYDIPFPTGHIALKSFKAEVVDESGVPVPLHETYLHHWVVSRYYAEKRTRADTRFSKFISARNSGVCNGTLGQYFGLGSETRRTLTWVPDPYGIEIGDPKTIPDGYYESWLLNIHAIDTREVKDRSGCIECKCDLYNVSKDKYGNSLPDDYIGGQRCCYDRTQCQLREGFNGGEVRKLYLRYTVKWSDWDETIVPVKIYIFDVTDTGKTPDAYHRTSCRVEYQVNPCRLDGVPNGECIDHRKTRVVFPGGGDIVYGVAHQHAGGIGSALYGQDGKLLCASIPAYGTGAEAGNEEGYIVGMTTCYPKPGSVKIADGEVLTVESNYSSSRLHTGVMGLFYILVAEPQARTVTGMLFHSLAMQWRAVVTEFWWAFVVVGGVALFVAGVGYGRKNTEGYQSL